MKTTKLALAVLFMAAVSFTSCKGNYDCDCGDGDVIPMKDIKKADAKKACDTWDALVKASGEAGCTLKKV